MEALRRRRGLGRSPRPRRTEGALEEARGLSGQLRQLTLQYFELGSCIVGGAAREQEVHQLEPRRDVRRSAGDHLAQVALLASPILRSGEARRATCARCSSRAAMFAGAPVTTWRR